jgi:hypothetical protein
VPASRTRTPSPRCGRFVLASDALLAALQGDAPARPKPPVSRLLLGGEDGCGFPMLDLSDVPFVDGDEFDGGATASSAAAPAAAAPPPAAAAPAATNMIVPIAAGIAKAVATAADLAACVAMRNQHGPSVVLPNDAHNHRFIVNADGLVRISIQVLASFLTIFDAPTGTSGTMSIAIVSLIEQELASIQNRAHQIQAELAVPAAAAGPPPV